MAKIRYYSGYDWKDISPEDIGAVSPDIIKQGENDPNQDTTIPPETKLYIQNSASSIDNQTVIRVNDSITLPLPIDQGGTGGTTKSDALANLGLDYISILQAVYPIGSIYISTVSTNPSTLFGFGTWKKIEGRFLVGDGSNNAQNQYEKLTVTLGDTGGEKNHVLNAAETALKNHSHGYAKPKASTEGHKLTVAEMPSHEHAITERYSSGTTSGWAYITENGKNHTSGARIASAGGSTAHSHNISTTTTATVSNPTNTNATNAHNNLPPYLVVNMWQRTA